MDGHGSRPSRQVEVQLRRTRDGGHQPLRQQHPEEQSQRDAAEAQQEALLEELPYDDAPPGTEGTRDTDFPQPLAKDHREPVERDQEPYQEAHQGETIEHELKPGEELPYARCPLGCFLDGDALRQGAGELAGNMLEVGVVIGDHVDLAYAPIA